MISINLVNGGVCKESVDRHECVHRSEVIRAYDGRISRVQMNQMCDWI